MSQLAFFLLVLVMMALGVVALYVATKPPSYRVVYTKRNPTRAGSGDIPDGGA